MMNCWQPDDFEFSQDRVTVNLSGKLTDENSTRTAHYMCNSLWRCEANNYCMNGALQV